MTRCSRPWPWSTSGVGELAAGGPVPPDQVAGLAEMAGSQERALRSLILRDPDEERTPAGAASLRAALVLGEFRRMGGTSEPGLTASPSSSCRGATS